MSYYSENGKRIFTNLNQTRKFDNGRDHNQHKLKGLKSVFGIFESGIHQRTSSISEGKVKIIFDMNDLMAMDVDKRRKVLRKASKELSDIVNK